ncbi:chlorohydrolase [Streptococcus pneumoniae]|nr:chlorohydrolase [Streptococcus pneumoniae]
MIEILIVLAIILSLALIVLVTIQPRQNQLFSMDATSNIGKPSYWQSNTLVKVLTLLVSLAFLYSMKIKEQTRKLAAGCSKHRFEVVDRTDEVSNIYTAR